jgi:hypothetical protein
MNKNLIKSGIFCFGLLVAGWCEAASFSEAIVFGDSLSDSGNYFTQFGGMSMQPYETENVPSELSLLFIRLTLQAVILAYK